MTCFVCARVWCRFLCRVGVGAALVVFGTSASASAAATPVSLAASDPSPQAVGTPVTFTATTQDSNRVVYQFSLGPAGGPYHVVRDFSLHNTFTWTPLQEGNQTVLVKAKEGFGATDVSSASLPYVVSPLATGSSAVVTGTTNPLLALYAAPPCGSGVIVVRFRAVGESSWSYTAPLPCRPGVTRNFLVAGMRAETAYVMQHLISSSSGITQSAPLTYTTGSVPTPASLPQLSFPAVSVPLAPTSQSDPLHNLVLHMLPLPRPGVADPFATDLSGRLVWYYDPGRTGLSNVMPNTIVPGGSILLLGSDGSTHASTVPSSLNVLREIDLAGDTIRETNVDAINAQLQARGQEHIYELHHEALRLPGGNTAVLAQTMQNINGTDVVGDMVIVLDPDFQVLWTWDAFNYAHRISNGNPYHPVLGELCSTGNPAALCAVPDPQALDWLHTNAISYSPADGNLIVSLRHQDWIVKIAYQNGHGDGHVIWRLGKNGDFTIFSTDPNPWFSHQHDPHYVGPNKIVLFDNGNTRCTGPGGSIIDGCHSRGQALTLDEPNRTATLTLNADLGGFSCALGSAQQLSPNNYAFGAGFFSTTPCVPGPASFGQSIETLADGSQAYAQQVDALEYRSFRLAGLYLGTDLG